MTKIDRFLAHFGVVTLKSYRYLQTVLVNQHDRQRRFRGLDDADVAVFEQRQFFGKVSPNAIRQR